MPLYLHYRPSFKRSLKRLGYEQKKIAGLILESLAAYYSSGCNLEEAQKIAPRFFYKQLRRPYYEAGIEGNIRFINRLIWAYPMVRLRSPLTLSVVEVPKKTPLFIPLRRRPRVCTWMSATIRGGSARNYGGNAKKRLLRGMSLNW